MGSGMTGHSGKTGHGGMHGMMGGGMMGMPCPMMGMMGDRAADPKLHGEMMVLNGQMMKKMAEMMAKQGNRMIEQGRNQAKEAGKYASSYFFMYHKPHTTMGRVPVWP